MRKVMPQVVSSLECVDCLLLPALASGREGKTETNKEQASKSGCERQCGASERSRLRNVTVKKKRR